MATTGPVQEAREKRKLQRRNATKVLNKLVLEKVKLKRPIFFVPGWTDERCACWKTAYIKTQTSMKEWISRIVVNKGLVEYVIFTTKESKACKSFLDFAEIVKEKIWCKVGKTKKIDVIGHSMGGLDLAAAIMDKDKPLLNVHTFITAATPHQGSQLGELGPKLKAIFPFVKRDESHIEAQCINLDPDQPPIQLVNRVELRKRLLKRINKLYCLKGNLDGAVSQRSAKLNKKDLAPNFYKDKVEIINFDGAKHSQRYGITQDSRAILAMLNILMGVKIKLERPKHNYGYIVRNK